MSKPTTTTIVPAASTRAVTPKPTKSEIIEALTRLKVEEIKAENDIREAAIAAQQEVVKKLALQHIDTSWAKFPETFSVENAEVSTGCRENHVDFTIRISTNPKDTYCYNNSLVVEAPTELKKALEKLHKLPNARNVHSYGVEESRHGIRLEQAAHALLPKRPHDPQRSLQTHRIHSITTPSPNPKSRMTPELESELARLRRYDTLLSEVLPTDFKDWHKNSKEEWPLVAQKVIQSLQDREALAWEMAEKNAKMAEKYQKLAEAYQEYSELLGEEIHDIIPLAYVHGWQSRRVEQGRLLREKIETLKARTSSPTLGAYPEFRISPTTQPNL